MTHAALVLCSFLVFAPAAAFAQDRDAADRPTRKGDTLTVKGCLTGAALQATEVSAPDAAPLLAGGLVFRLTGAKGTLKALREEHDRKVVEVRGILKSDLPQHSVQGRNVGRMRITVGGARPDAGRLEAEPRRMLPVLEVKSFSGSGHTPCAR